MWSAIASILLGIVGWFATSFFAKPLIDFLDLRRQVHEEIIYSANISLHQWEDEKQRPVFTAAVDRLRRLGAKLHALNVAAAWPLRTFLRKFGYDLKSAAGGMIGISNDLGRRDGELALHKNDVQRALRLPRDYTDEHITQIVRRIHRGDRE